MYQVLLALILLFPSPSNGQFLFFGRCPGGDRCGFFGFRVVMHSGTPGTSDCVESCLFFQARTLECGGCGIDAEEVLTSAPFAPSLPSSPVSAPAPSTPVISEFDITLKLIGMPTSDAATFANAAARWESIIVGDLSDVNSNTLEVLGGGCTYPSIIDDVYICGKFETIDGLNNVVGSAGPIHTRFENDLTIVGSMKFDSADISAMRSDGTFTNVILHEMGHVLGTRISRATIKIVRASS
jgi:hypothetical protein